MLLTGNGSNLQAIIDACQNGEIPNAIIVRVISNREKAFGLERARKASIPTAYVKLVELGASDFALIMISIVF